MFQDYFSFTRTERRGIAILIVLITLFSLLPLSYAFLFPNDDLLIDYEALAPQIAQWDSLSPNSNSDTVAVELFKFNPNVATREDFFRLGLSPKTARNIINYRTKGGKFYKKEDFKKIWSLDSLDYVRLSPYIIFSVEVEQNRSPNVGRLFAFDPNTATKKQFIQLGLTEKVANTIINYRTKGGKFRYKSDFKKIWGLTEANYNRLEPYINISSSPVPDNIPTSYDDKNEKIDVNTATKDDFIKLYGIGEKTATRIIKFRDALGGFHSVDQVGDTYGFDPTTFANLKPKFIIKNKTVKQININTSTADELKKHPYINWKTANAIVKYRDQHGNFGSIRDLKNIYIIDGDLFVKLSPYVTVD